MIYDKTYDKSRSGVDENVEMGLTIRQVNVLEKAIGKYKFWSMKKKEGGEGLDGEGWLIERVNNGRYHVVARCTPEDGEVYRLGTYIESLVHK